MRRLLLCGREIVGRIENWIEGWSSHHTHTLGLLRTLTSLVALVITSFIAFRVFGLI